MAHLRKLLKATRDFLTTTANSDKKALEHTWNNIKFYESVYKKLVEAELAAEEHLKGQVKREVAIRMFEKFSESYYSWQEAVLEHSYKLTEIPSHNKNLERELVVLEKALKEHGADFENVLHQNLERVVKELNTLSNMIKQKYPNWFSHSDELWKLMTTVFLTSTGYCVLETFVSTNLALLFCLGFAGYAVCKRIPSVRKEFGFLKAQNRLEALKNKVYLLGGALGVPPAVIRRQMLNSKST